ncbi:ABC transporter [Serendipita vermifera]|nr:ABC transporter [Serendipita vermifera]
MAENSTLSNTRAGTPLQKEDIIDAATNLDALTRVNTSERTSLPETKVADNKDAASVLEKPISVSHDGQEETYLLTGKKLVLAHTGFLLAIFCTSLDQTIVATALPKLASQFNALDELTWVVSAYFLTQAGLMLTFGQILTIAPSKWVYLICIVLFEIGSLICGVAPSMNVLIFGRAFQGIGASGLFIAILTILSQITKLEQRPLLFGTFGGCFALASVLGPLLGGAFTDKVTWRWCFYINLPFGAISLAVAMLFVPSNAPAETKLYENMTTLQKWLSLDWIGSALSVAMITCLLLPLQWGGVTRPWNDKAVIALFCVFGVLLFVFLGWEFFKGERAMMPLSLFKRRTQSGASAANFMLWISFLAATYYLPFFYQAKGRTAAQSGIDIIPFMLTCVIASFISGAIVNATGHYWTMMILGPLISAVGAGLLFTIDEFTSTPKLIGFQILFGTGLGVSGQMPVMAIQAEYADDPSLIPQASSLLSFFQLLGAAVGMAIAGTVFNNQLVKTLAQYASDLSPEMITAVKQSVTVIFTLSPDKQGPVVHSYVKALVYTFIMTVPSSVLATFFGLFMKNWNLKKRGASAGAAGAA